ncbi:MAG: PAS domain-containing protein [Acidobacteria bacterium]|nr:PAS domain-containing protein [Acidobacteriota bacterium]
MSPPSDPGQAPVVGIGASAGGLEALKAFFGVMPPKSGLVFVVVVHLDPTHESLMPELLAKSTALTVAQARDRQPLEADHVYIIPPNRSLTIDQGLIRVREVADRRGLRGAIDHFFRSLAEDQHEKAIGIVLSGTGTEGTLGLRAIKAEGGLAMAQAPDSASQPGMPNSAIATGLVDFVLPPDKMPKALLTYVRNTQVRRMIAGAPEAKPVDDLHRILAVLRARTKYDFRGYKKGTLQRRIERRMGLQQIDSLGKYADCLRSHPAEADQLFKDLLIGVTSLFRDSAAFEELGKVLKGLVKENDADSPIRIWVPGCATGEEAYSIAILMAEQIAAAQSPCRVQIFATDIDEDALEMARAGTYPESIALDVTPQRLQRFFTREDHRYTIVKSIRESVTFAVQNLISDPPFSKLDLVSCRNVLIYLEPDVQEKLLSLFHFALNPGGYLFLGSAEHIGPLEELFTPVSKRRRLFRRLGPPRRPALELPTPLVPVDAGRAPAKIAPEPTVATLADRQLLEHFAPTGVVVKRSGHIVRSYGAMDRYLTVPPGDVTLDILTLARDPLKPTLRAALHDAFRRNRRTVVETLELTRDKGRTNLRITVRPLATSTAGESLWTIIFEESALSAGATARRRIGRKESDLVRRLELELRSTKKAQQHLIEQLESGNEELKAANEEVLSMNEELQSTNEELTTSKEELQSMNEELTTLNAQLQDKVQELTAVNDDLANLLVSTDIATVFVDNDFHIKRFTTAATHLLNLLPSDVGRPINHLATNLVDVDLSRDARMVLAALTPIEKEVAAQDGKQYFMRLLPYRSETTQVAGVVLTLVDVTALKTTERELRAAQGQLRHLNQALEERIAQRTKWLTLLHDVTRAIGEASSWDEALAAVLRRICEAEKWQVACVYLPDRETPDQLVSTIVCSEGDRFQPFRRATEQMRFARPQSLPGRVYAEGAPVWFDSQEDLLEALPFRAEAARAVGLLAATALPVTFGSETVAVLELFSDHPHRPSEELSSLMNDVGAQIARVVERERLTAQMAGLVWREQQELLHTLHDSLGQTLTGLGMLSAALNQRLTDTDAATAAAAQQIARQAQQALEQVRQLSRGLLPVEVDPEGLIPALQQLASTAESLHKVAVRVEGHEPIPVRDARIATQLYRIAQEAVTNVVKHAQAHTIRIHIGSESGLLTLCVADDGIGIDKTTPKHEGLGLRIMHYRARSIGAHLAVEPGTAGGTIVTCSLRQVPPPLAPPVAQSRGDSVDRC